MMDALHTGVFCILFLDTSGINTGMPLTCFFKNFESSCVYLRIYLSRGTNILIIVCGAEKAQCDGVYQMEFPRIETFLRMRIL